MRIFTLTLNPAFDVHCTAKNFETGKENTAEIISRDAGGKGINISRALTANSIENIAVAVLGKENAKSFTDELKDIGELRTATVDGRIRENITVHAQGRETRLSFLGFRADATIFDEIRALLSDIENGDILTLTGRLPLGVPVENAKEMLIELKDRGVRTVIDSRSFALNDLLDVKPFLIKPNEEEITQYTGKTFKNINNACSAAEVLHRQGIQNVMISFGAQGALLACDEGTFICSAPRIDPISTIGAGDSSIAGFIAASKNGASKELCLKNAIAYGSAACLTEGTNPPRAGDIEKFL